MKKHQGYLRRALNVAKAVVRSAFEDGWRLTISVVAAEAILMSLLHHLASIWEMTGERQLIALLIAGPALGILFALGLKPIWCEAREIHRVRWLSFAGPAILLAGIVTAQVFETPEVEHELTITPLVGTPTGRVRIEEVRAAYGNVVPLARLASVPGWGTENGMLATEGPSPESLVLRFRGPVGEQVRISFLTSPGGGRATVHLDGRRITIDLLGPAENVTRARLNTQYRWGVFNGAFLPLLIFIDGLAIVSGLAMVWLLHEIGQRRIAATGTLCDRSVPSPHALGIAAICAVALLLHAVDFVTIPLRVTKDGPSYLQGAMHFAEHGNLDGATSYRGPGTTFLFAPARVLFGRNPLGVKLELHLLAFFCVPLAYAIGWQLTSRRWVAVASGVLTTIAPDLFAYSDVVLSEVPHIFSLVLYGAALLAALRRPSFRRMAAAMLAGSFAVLVRPDNSVAFGLGTVALTAAVLWRQAFAADGGGHPGRPRVALVAVLFGVILGLVPILAWSLHNLRVHGFFGISDYAGEVLYDGWIYYGENSGTRILDRHSQLARQIDAAVPILRENRSLPTGWQVYDGLRTAGYTSEQAFSMLGRLALDSVAGQPERALELLVLKFKEAAIPQATLPVSLAAPAGENPYAELTSLYFDGEPWLMPRRGRLETAIRSLLLTTYGPFYSALLALAVLSWWLGLYRNPPGLWIAYLVLGANALLLPVVMGVASWRYILPGIILLGPITFAAADSISHGVGIRARASGQPATAAR